MNSLTIDGLRIEAEWHGPPPEIAPTLVLLHEGLGCVTMWRDFPAALAKRTGCGVLAYSRRGYGSSDPRPLPWPCSYMHDEAFDVLPYVLDAAGIRKTILVGHSDGASIATIYAGGRQDFRVRGLALMAPHFFIEDVTVASIAQAQQSYDSGELRERLARHHKNVDIAFRGFSEPWLRPECRSWRIDEYIAYIRVPILIVQGEDDQYGTLDQVKLAKETAYCPVETLVLPNCRHSPQFDRPEPTLNAIGEFVRRVVIHEGLRPLAQRA
jgi:pimeloyl-ACP methyl ester carboxylesterase